LTYQTINCIHPDGITLIRSDGAGVSVCLFTCYLSCLLQYYEMSYGLNVEMHRQVNVHISHLFVTA